MPWKFYSHITQYAAHEKHKQKAGAACALAGEFGRLDKQVCPYCDGYGHSGNDCPTDAKISHLRRGVREQNELLQDIRKTLRAGSGMGQMTGFSLLSAQRPPKCRKRTRSELTSDAASINEIMYAKRPKFP